MERVSSPMDWLADKRLQQRLKDSDEDFMHYHIVIVDLLKQYDDIEVKQAAINDHEDRVGNLGDCIQHLIRQNVPVWKEPTDPQRRGLHGHLALIETELWDVANTV